jgi:Sec23/Sec24 beta-sandwich domain
MVPNERRVPSAARSALMLTADEPWNLAPPQVDPDKAFAVQVVLEESVVASRVSYVQCALLYTNSNGERRIRWVATKGSSMLGLAGCCGLLSGVRERTIIHTKVAPCAFHILIWRSTRSISSRTQLLS